ncbi:MAG TPA: hypothetical protein VMQ73_23595 [Methylomirabilota bacterium]|nr:hypothetical protein [Methylomirabilota bacterium]
MPTFTLCVFNETALANSDFAQGLADAKSYFTQVAAAKKIDVDFKQMPKNGAITKNTMAQRPAGAKLLCLVDDAQRGVKVADLFDFKLTESQKTDAYGQRVLGMGPIRKPGIFLWDFEVNGTRRYGDTFDARLRGNCLHELGHSFGLLHEKDATNKDRSDDLDLMVPEPNTRDPSAHYVPVDATHVATWVEVFVKNDKGGFHYIAA